MKGMINLAIHKEELEFLEETKTAFERNPEYTTWRNQDETLIALRYGFRRTDILIYRIEKVELFTDVVSKGPNIIIKEEE